MANIEFDPKLDWIDVPDPQNPPAGADKIMAADLLRYETFMSQAVDAINAAGAEGVVDPDDPNAVMLMIAGAIKKLPTLDPATQKLWDTHMPARLSDKALSLKIESEAGEITGLAGGKNYLLLGLEDPVPTGTPAGTMIYRSANVTSPTDPGGGGVVPDPTTLALLAAQGDFTTTYLSSTTLPLDKPAKAKVGDTLVAIVTHQNPAQVADAVITPSNWTRISSDSYPKYRPTAIMVRTIKSEAELVAVPNTTNFSVATGIPAARMAGAMFRVVNANLTTPGAGSSGWEGASNVSASTLTIPSFTADVTTGLSIAIFPMNNSNPPPDLGIPGMTKVGQFGYPGPGSNTQFGVFVAQFNTATVPARTVNGDVPWTNGAGVQVALRNK